MWNTVKDGKDLQKSFDFLKLVNSGTICKMMQPNSKFTGVWEQFKHYLVYLVKNYECVKAMNTMYTFKLYRTCLYMENFVQ